MNSGKDRMSRNKAAGVYCSILFAIALSFFIAGNAGATCTQNFHYKSGKLSVDFQGNYGSENTDEAFFKDIKTILPQIISLSRGIGQKGEPVDIFIGCQQYNKAVMEISKKEHKTVSCDSSGLATALSDLAAGLNISIGRVHDFKGFTLQIAYVAHDKEAVKAIKRWRDRLENAEYNGTVYVVGDCTLTPIWLHKYPDNSAAIRFGIFDNYQNAKKAIGLLKLAEKNAQIVPVRFKVKNISKYFY
jgi:hypothetical protein